MVVCIWSVQRQDAAFSGAGFVRQNGQENVWEIIGLDNVVWDRYTVRDVLYSQNIEIFGHKSRVSKN